MRYDDFRRSDDIEDRRDDSGGGGGGGAFSDSPSTKRRKKQDNDRDNFCTINEQNDVLIQILAAFVCTGELE